MKEQLLKLKEAALEEIQAVSAMDELDSIKVKYSGKKGELTKLLKGMGKLSAEERPVMGKVANEVRELIETKINEKRTALKKIEQEAKLQSEVIDVTMPGKVFNVGKKHPITQIIDEVSEIFMGLGFSVVEGPEVETVENNFDALNAPKDHPSRDMSDTFYFNENLLLRTQTSPVQVRTMRSEELPIKIVSPGRCFRNDSLDATHSPMFHQIEGLVVGKDITMAQFKGTVEMFVKKLFGEETKTKFRPHNFPFTEPSAEVDVSCFKCGGKGCSMCKGEGWIEILGSGMVHRYKERDLVNNINQDDKFVLILDRIQDPGNMGTIIRTADSAGVDAIILLKGCVDIYNPKVIRSTMGSIFDMNIIQTTQDEAVDFLKANNFDIVSSYLHTESYYNETTYDGKIALVIGNEANGINDELISKSDKLVKIPIYGNAESLNAAISAAILMYEIKKYLV